LSVNPLSFPFLFRDQTYVILVTFKRMRRITFRLDGTTIHVSAPLRTSRDVLETVLPKVIVRLLKKYRPLPVRSDAFLWLGEWVQLHDCPLPTGEEKKDAMRTYALPKIKQFVRELGVSLPRLTTRMMKTRWGSYSKKTHRITLSTQLIHYPPNVIDAVIAHEVAHIVHLDHSPRFYATLHRLYPNYATDHAQLKQGLNDHEID
jgi:predicted metal-dependent hydrolase